MGDETVPVGPADAVAAPTPSPSPAAALTARAEKRAEKLASINAGLKKIESESLPAGPSASPAVEEKPAEAPVVAKAAPEEKPEGDKPDPKTAKGLEAIEKRDRRAREELAAEKAAFKAERDLAIAEITRLRAEVTGKATSFEELQKLARKSPLEVLKRLGLESEDDMEAVSRATYAVSKSGKADPKNKAYADQTAKERELAAELAELRKTTAELAEQFKTRDQQAAMEQFQARWLDDGIKALPAEPTLIGLLHAKAPAKARAAMLELGKRMEAESGETPSHAEVIAEYERARTAELEEQGVDVAAMLKRPAPAPAKPAPPKTLDITSTGATKPINGTQTRADKLAAINAGLKRLEAAT